MHVMSLAVVFSYSMYFEVAERNLEQTWKDNNIVVFWKFCYLLSNQMLKYNSTHRKYAGDTNMIPNTQKNQAARVEQV